MSSSFIKVSVGTCGKLGVGSEKSSTWVERHPGQSGEEILGIQARLKCAPLSVCAKGIRALSVWSAL